MGFCWKCFMDAKHRESLQLSCCHLGSLTAGVERVSASWTLPASQAGAAEHSWNTLLPDALFPFQSSLLWKRWTSRKVPLDPEGDGAAFWVIPLSRFDRRSQALAVRQSGTCASSLGPVIFIHLCPFFCELRISFFHAQYSAGVTDTVLWRAGQYHCCCLSCECWRGAGSSMFKT